MGLVLSSGVDFCLVGVIWVGVLCVRCVLEWKVGLGVDGVLGWMAGLCVLCSVLDSGAWGVFVWSLGLIGVFCGRVWIFGCVMGWRVGFGCVFCFGLWACGSVLVWRVRIGGVSSVLDCGLVEVFLFGG